MIVSKPNHILNILENREIGKQSAISDLRTAVISINIFKNIFEQNYKETQFNTTIGCQKFDVQNNFLASVNRIQGINVWYYQTNEFLWSFNRNSINWGNFIKIFENKVICLGAASENPFNAKIYVLNLITGQEICTISDPRILINRRDCTSRICFIKDHVFAILNDGNIGEWSMEGRLVNVIQAKLVDLESEFLGLRNFFLGLDSFLVYIHNNKLTTINLEKKEIHHKLFSVLDIPLFISAVHLEKKSLICGFKKSILNSPDCCVINLENDVLNSYEGKILENEIDTFENNPYHSSVSVCKIQVHENIIFLGISTGTVVMIDLIKNTHLILDKHHNAIHALKIDNGILICGSRGQSVRLGKYPAELKFWDLNSMTNIGKMEIDEWFPKFSLSSGSVFFKFNSSIIQRDFA